MLNTTEPHDINNMRVYVSEVYGENHCSAFEDEESFSPSFKGKDSHSIWRLPYIYVLGPRNIQALLFGGIFCNSCSFHFNLIPGVFPSNAQRYLLYSGKKQEKGTVHKTISTHV